VRSLNWDSGIMQIEAIMELLECDTLPGSAREQEVLGIRISDLVRLNGEAWVKEHRRQLVQEWETIVRHGLIR